MIITSFDRKNPPHEEGQEAEEGGGSILCTPGPRAQLGSQQTITLSVSLVPLVFNLF